MVKHDNRSDDEFVRQIQDVTPLVFNTLYKEIRDKDTVDDIIQTAAAKAYKAYARFRGESNFKNWFFVIVTNAKNDYYNTLKKRRNEIAIETAFSNNEENIAALDWFHHSFDDEIDNISVKDNISRILSYLPTKDRKLIEMLFFEDMSPREASAILNQTEEHIRVRKQRALDKLKIVMLTDRYEEELAHEAEAVYVRFLKEELSKNEKALAIEILMNRTTFGELSSVTGTDEDVLRVRYLRILTKLSDYIKEKKYER